MARPEAKLGFTTRLSNGVPTITEVGAEYIDEAHRAHILTHTDRSAMYFENHDLRLADRETLQHLATELREEQDVQVLARRIHALIPWNPATIDGDCRSVETLLDCVRLLIDKIEEHNKTSEQEGTVK